MKTFTISLILLATAITSFSQSKSFETLKDKFVGGDQVVSVSTGGFLLRTALWIAGEADWRRDFGDVRGVRLINIPQKAFEARNLKLSGFKKYVTKDDFEEVVHARDGRDRITVYMKEYDKRSNLYLVLVENDDHVTAIELKGRLDPQKLVGDTYSERNPRKL